MRTPRIPDLKIDMQHQTNRPKTRQALLTLAAFSLGFAGLGAIAQTPEQATPKVQPTSAVDAVTVASTLKEGETFRYSIRSRSVQQHQKPDESIVKWINRRTLLISCVVLEPDEEIGPRVQVTFDEISLALLSPTKALRYSSVNQQMNTIGAAVTVAMDPIVDASITLTLDHEGVIRQIAGTDRLLREKELRQYSEHIVGEDAIDQLLGPIFHPMAEPVSDTGSEPWQSREQMRFEDFATIDFREEWILRRKNAGRATFKIMSDVTAEFDERWPKAVLADHRTIGTYTWDEVTGRLHHTEINRFYVGDLENDPDGPSIAGEEVLTISAPIGDN